jgi:RHS repeat-associated protein
VYFAGRLIKQNTDAVLASADNNFVAVDRMGSVVYAAATSAGAPTVNTSYLPYGEELSATTNDVIKFATYTRDSSTGLDYADQRYYTSQFGRFMSADRFKRAAKVNDSGSWNKYSYTRGDPANLVDPSGQDDCSADFCATGYGYSYDCPPGMFPSNGGCVTAVNDGAGKGLPSGGGGSFSSSTTYYSLAQRIARTVATGSISDCTGLADFAAGAAAISTSSAQFESAFSVLTPPANFESLTGVSWNTDPVVLGGHTGEVSGFATQYQDGYGSPSGANNSDQAHHFAAFFQLGYNLPPGLSNFGAYFQEWFEGTLSNQGDINLAIAAASLGYAVRNGSLSPSQVSSAIQNTICQH